MKMTTIYIEYWGQREIGHLWVEELDHSLFILYITYDMLSKGNEDHLRIQ